MVRAVFYLGRKLPYQGFALTGHSGHAAYGQDIVCAGISGLALSIAQGLEHYLETKVIIDQAESGWLQVLVSEGICTDQELCRAEALFGTLKLGFESIIKRYPGTMEIVESEV